MARTLHLTLNVWRQSQDDAQGRLVTYDVPDISEDMSFLEMLRHRQRPFAGRRRRADRVRARLPRGHLRLVRDDDQRTGARFTARHGDVSAAHAQVPGRRRDHGRAVAGGGVPGRQGSRRQPQRARSHRRSRRLHHRHRWRRAGSEPHAHSEDGRRRRVRRGRVHRVRRVRRHARTAPPSCSRRRR